jgi:thioredoxin-dependent peroxiredoxin
VPLGGTKNNHFTQAEEKKTMLNKIVSIVLLVAAAAMTVYAGEDTMLLRIGEKAPDFSLVSSSGDTVKLSDFAGKTNVVLFFYPGDETPGCTKQLCAVRDDFSVFEAKGIKVFGVNPGNSDSHKKFIKVHGFQFQLLIDQDQKVAKLYGCNGWPIVKRTVYGIDKQGALVYEKRGMPANTEIVKAFTEEKMK